MSGPRISVVIPAYNEEHRLERTLRHIAGFLRERGDAFEVIVVDDASTDGTPSLAQALADRQAETAIRVLRNTANRGKGYSVRRGMLEAEGELGLLTDADLSTPIEELTKLEQAVLEEGYAIAFGSRDVPGSDVQIRQSRFRESSGKTFNHFVHLLTELPYRDTQCGFKLFQMSVCRDIFKKQRIERFGFDVELLFIARKWHLRMKEIPVIWRHSEGSKVRFLPDAAVMLLELMKIRWNNFRGCYDREDHDQTRG